MITIHDLQDQMELQGEIRVRQWDHEEDDWKFYTSLDEIPSDSPILDRAIAYMYSEIVWKSIYKPGATGATPEPTAMLFIELESHYEDGVEH